MSAIFVLGPALMVLGVLLIVSPWPGSLYPALCNCPCLSCAVHGRLRAHPGMRSCLPFGRGATQRVFCGRVEGNTGGGYSRTFFVLLCVLHSAQGDVIGNPPGKTAKLYNSQARDYLCA